jgi:hypothetical protein
MSEQALQQIRQLLPSLIDTELQQVILLATRLRSRADTDSELNDWYNALSTALISRVDWRIPPMKALPDHTKAQLRRTYDALIEWLHESFKPPLTKVEQRWALQWCAQMLADSLLERDRPLCLNGLLNASPEIPWVVNEAFPGYLKNGALRWVIKNSIVTKENS